MAVTPTRGFAGRGAPHDPAARDRVPPGQHLVPDFPVLSLGPTPRVRPADWVLDLRVGPKPAGRWTWQEFNALPQTKWTRDIHCVTTWSKLDTSWEGVLFDDLLRAAGLDAPPTPFVLAHSSDGYSTNVPVADLTGQQAMVATRYGGEPLEPEHGGPARLLVPHLYLWKSAKWLKGIQFTSRDEAGFWELRGYHMRGDPWKEERYSDD
jgi:DMSO/TMAO reductase YedYZ molybdopterin-dependent catalytic subunit